MAPKGGNFLSVCYAEQLSAVHNFPIFPEVGLAPTIEGIQKDQIRKISGDNAPVRTKGP